MQINFFEEFPTDENLSKLKYIDFKSLVLVAAHSLDEFLTIESKISKINKDLEVGYWPILKKSYWISPFSYPSELKTLFSELKGYASNNQKSNLNVLLDLEFPLMHRSLFIKNLFNFFSNKNRIKSFFEYSKDSNIKIYTAEYPISSSAGRFLLKTSGVSYSIHTYHHKPIVMMYSSMLKNKMLYKMIRNYISTHHKSGNTRLPIALGTIDIGILGDEPILPPESLDKDLTYCIKNNINEVFIFRAGGLNKEYMKVIKKYLD